MAAKSSGAAKKKAGTAKKATKSRKAAVSGGESGGGKLTLSRQTLKDLEALTREAAGAQSQKVCVA
jgi:hypothetical protein